MSFPTELMCDKASESLYALMREFPIHDYMEIGCYHGTNAAAMMYAMQPGGVMWLLDYQDMVLKAAEVMQATLEKRPLAHDLSIRTVGNSRKLYDSYCWTLGLLLLSEHRPELDLVFLDGAHTWHHDGFAYCLVSNMIRPGGFLVLDDCHWSMGASSSLAPSVRPETADEYTEEQISYPQVQMVARLVEMDSRFELFRICDDNDNKRIYRKKLVVD